MTEHLPQTLGAALPLDTGVCVINLDSRADRWELFQKEILPHFDGLPVDRISATLGTQIQGFGKKPFFRGKKRDRTWAARGGCTLSHRDALLHAKAKGWKYLLILEDDISIEAAPSPAFLASLQKSLQSISFDVCYLGFTDPIPPFRQLVDLGCNHALHQVFGCNTAHAYLLNTASINWILDRLPTPADIWPWLARHRAVDRFFYQHLSPHLTVTAISPSLIFQRPCFSDIVGKEVASSTEAHVTCIDSLYPEPCVFNAGMRSQAAAFKRAGVLDQLRGIWKRLNGF
jgi:GR25 family glycosyltransferase involved in LPS biosynthesis